MPYADPDKQREYQREWARRYREENPEHVRKVREEWQERRRGVVRRGRYHRRRQEAIERLGGECVECGTAEDLEFDHIDPDSKVAWFNKLFEGGSQQRIDAELEKAQLLCSVCHGRKTYREVALNEMAQ